jgi:hypothetical protein
MPIIDSPENLNKSGMSIECSTLIEAIEKHDII